MQDLQLAGPSASDLHIRQAFRHSLTSSPACPSCPVPKMLITYCCNATGPKKFGIGFPHVLQTPFLARSRIFGVRSLQVTPQTPSVPQVIWNIWKRQNSLVFNGEDEAAAVTAKRCVADIRLWSFRCQDAVVKDVLISWCSNFDPP